MKVSRAKPARAGRRPCSCGYRLAQLVAPGCDSKRTWIADPARQVPIAEITAKIEDANTWGYDVAGGNARRAGV